MNPNFNNQNYNNYNQNYNNYNSNQGNYNQNPNYNNMNQYQQKYNMPNMEQSLQKEKYSSANISSHNPKKSQKERSSNNRTKENISQIKEESNAYLDENKSQDINSISKDNTDQMISLKQFVKLFTKADYGFKKFVKKACKTSIIDILKAQSFAEILTNKKKDEFYS
jgi:hypothetical protein